MAFIKWFPPVQNLHASYFQPHILNAEPCSDVTCQSSEYSHWIVYRGLCLCDTDNIQIKGDFQKIYDNEGSQISSNLCSTQISPAQSISVTLLFTFFWRTWPDIKLFTLTCLQKAACWWQIGRRDRGRSLTICGSTNLNYNGWTLLYFIIIFWQRSIKSFKN